VLPPWRDRRYSAALAVTEPAVGFTVAREVVTKIYAISCAIGIVSGVVAIGMVYGLALIREAFGNKGDLNDKPVSGR